MLRGEPAVRGVPVVHHSARGMAAAAVSDVVDDGLIEIATLAQLDAVRHDLDGDGVPAGAGAAASGATAPGAAAGSGAAAVAGAAAHAAAFAEAAEGMGCPAAGCLGYELAADLDFDTERQRRSGHRDAFWNGGAGWRPPHVRRPIRRGVRGQRADGVAPVRGGW